MKATDEMAKIPTPAIGGLTFDSEGHEGGRHHSRKPHVPSDASGVTIGRGYDMKMRSGNQIVAELKAAGLGGADSEKFRAASVITGAAAKAFLKDKALADFEITGEQQLALFKITYAAIEADTKRLCTKKDVVDTYGDCDWDKLDLSIREMLVDLRFRGDYTHAVRQIVQKSAAVNDLATFSKAIRKVNAPADRYERRIRYLSVALARQTVTTNLAQKPK